MLPEYLPGIHPILIHFPIALLFSAALVDVVAALARRNRLRDGATALLVAGTVFLPLTYWTGRLASDRAISPFPRAQAVMSEHSDLAWLTLWVFVALTMFRLVLAYRARLQRGPHVVTTLLLVAATGLLGVTADRGGRLVFDLGVGVRPVREAPEGAFDPLPEPDPAVLGPTVGKDGSVRWTFQEGAESVLDRFLAPLEGAIPMASVESQRAALVFTKDHPERAVLALGDPIEGASMRLRVRRDGFQGIVGLALHAGDETLDYALWDGATLTLGVQRHGVDEILDSAPTATRDGWHEIELVAAGTHYRAYLDGELLVHGHAAAPSAGPAALLFDGTGEVRLDDLRIAPLTE